jgi:hypothetical protein
MKTCKHCGRRATYYSNDGIDEPGSLVEVVFLCDAHVHHAKDPKRIEDEGDESNTRRRG